MAALLGQGARRIAGSVLHRTQAAVTSPAFGEERRRLVPRRMYTTEKEVLRDIERKLDKELRDRVDRLKPHQVYWELIKLFPARKIFNVVVLTGVLGGAISASIEMKQAEKKQQKRTRV